MNINNSTFIITGGGSGLGAATAEMLINAGGTVILADVNEEAGNQKADDLGVNAHFINTDVTSAESVQAAVDLATAQDAPLRGAINCAGIAIAQRTLSRKGAHDLESYSKVIQVNLIGTFNMARLAAEAMATTEPLEDGERGVIINTASVAAYDGQIGQTAYASSKGGVVGLTLPLARDLARHGIRVATIAPGIFETPMLAGLPEAARASLGQQVPFPQRLGRPDEYAATAKFIIENTMLNGEVIRLDGAIRMAPQ